MFDQWRIKSKQIQIKDRSKQSSLNEDRNISKSCQLRPAVSHWCFCSRINNLVWVFDLSLFSHNSSRWESMHSSVPLFSAEFHAFHFSRLLTFQFFRSPPFSPPQLLTLKPFLICLFSWLICLDDKSIRKISGSYICSILNYNSIGFATCLLQSSYENDCNEMKTWILYMLFHNSKSWLQGYIFS